MGDSDKTKEQRINELVEMRGRMASLKALETEHKQAEEEWRATFDCITELVSIQDRDFRLVRVNKAFADALKKKPEELVGRHCYEVVHYTDGPAPNCPHKKTLETGKPVMAEFFEPHLGMHIEVSTSPVFNEKGEVVASAHVVRDITERKQAEDKLRQSEQNLRTYLESAPDAVYINDLKGTFLYGNKKAEGITGYKREELVGMNFLKLNLLPAKHLAKAGKLLALNAIGRATGPDEIELIRKDGSHIWTEITTTPIKQEGKVVVIGFVRDITERKRAEKEIRDLAKFPSENPNPVLRVAKNGTILYANQASLPLLNVWGCEIGQPLPDHLRRSISGVLGSGSPEYIEVECGEQTFSFMLAPIADAAYVNIYGHDITERKRVAKEKEEMEQKTRVASRLATIGQMASGIAHEINNPLTSVIGFAELLRKRDTPEDIKPELDIIRDSAQRVASIVKRLLIFARQQEPERKSLDINETIASTVAMRAYELDTNNIQVTMQLAPDLPATIADSGQLQQVFLNIILNAETEMMLAHGKGTLVIKTEPIDNTIRVSFKDDGPGIPKENLERVFDPFFTTREVGDGTGLGLSVCHGIMAEHGGRIHAESELGKGATFIVELPIVTEAGEPKLVEPVADEVRREIKAKILIVDDEPIVQQLLTEILTEAGYNVETVDNGIDAVEKLKSNRYGLILLDIKMRGMSGIELYKHLQKKSRSLAKTVVFITGDVIGEVTLKFLRKTKVPYITKPFTEELLLKEVNSRITPDR